MVVVVVVVIKNILKLINNRSLSWKSNIFRILLVGNRVSYACIIRINRKLPIGFR